MNNWYIKNKEKILEKNKQYRKEHKEELRLKKHIKYLKNKEIIYNKNRKWRLKNKSKVVNYYKNYRKKIRNNNSNQQIIDSLRARINKAVFRKNIKTTILIGCTVVELRNHLEKQFKEGMNWNNYGKNGWHIDHIIPCSLFDLTKLDEQKICFHYTNLQPLWWRENIIKGKT